MAELSPIASAGSSVAGSVVSSFGNIVANRKAVQSQAALNRQRYRDYLEFGREAGATPAAIAQGLTGAGAGQMPTASTSNNPFYDFGQSYSSGISAAASNRSAAAAETTANSEKEINDMKLHFEPLKYFVDVRKGLAEAFRDVKQGYMFDSMKGHYDELIKDIQQVRPWKLAGLRQGLLNDMATFNKIVQETRTSKALQGYYETGSELNLSQKDLNYTRSLNESLEGYRLQFENTFLTFGIDPTKPFWDNTLRLMSTNPSLFKDRMDSFITGLNIIDNRIQENLGEHYKRNIALGYGLYKGNQMINSYLNSKSKRNSNAINTISSLVPMLGGFGSTPAPIGFYR